jgi:hypothetical protein
MTETREQYKARILSYLAGRAPIPLLATAPDMLEALIDGVPEPLLSGTSA